MDCNNALSGCRARAIPHIEGVSPKPLELKEMVCIPTCYTEKSIEVRALNVTMPEWQCQINASGLKESSNVGYQAAS